MISARQLHAGSRASIGFCDGSPTALIACQSLGRKTESPGSWLVADDMTPTPFPPQGLQTLVGNFGWGGREHEGAQRVLQAMEGFSTLDKPSLSEVLLYPRYREIHSLLLSVLYLANNSSFNSDGPSDYPQAAGLSGGHPGFAPASATAGDVSFAKSGRGPAFSPRDIHGKAKSLTKRVAIAQPRLVLAPGVRGGGSRLIRTDMASIGNNYWRDMSFM